ncbi:MAG TPA: glucosamine-6-phosphate deaminase [Clostridia bacterium]|nr:glucosamine-6-phosphate deaminase [Clostridia bacterium]
MRLIIEDDYQQMSKKAALLLASQVRLKPNSVLGLATGSTPLGMYNELVSMYQKDEIDFSEVKTFNLDEYYPLSPDNPKSYHHYMYENFFNHINIRQKNINILDGMADNVEHETTEYEIKIHETGGIDLQILGVGSNGHIGFNEPAERLNVTTHLVNLSEETIKANSRFFANKENVPSKAITVGIATILKANRILLLASGENKARVIKETISGHISTQVPSSLLQTHPEVAVIIDKNAASML